MDGDLRRHSRYCYQLQEGFVHRHPQQICCPKLQDVLRSAVADKHYLTPFVIYHTGPISVVVMSCSPSWESIRSMNKGFSRSNVPLSVCVPSDVMESIFISMDG